MIINDFIYLSLIFLTLFRFSFWLWIFFKTFNRKLQNCRDTRLEEPFARNNHDRIIEKLNDVRPKGTTPIAYSLQQAAKDFPENDNYRNIVIIITDGIESCDGDAVQGI